MKTAVYSALLAAVLAASVNAHGQMTSPTPRPVTDKFRADSGTLKYAGDQELQYAPVENLSERKQADQPAAATFDIMNGCRGMVYEAGGPVTNVAPGATIPVKWTIQAPHPGYAEFSIVKATTGAGGKTMYEKMTSLKRIEDFAKTGGDGETTVTIPASVTGCGTAGACALQMYWHSDIANQTYPTCADIVVTGSGAAAASGGSSSASTPTATTKAPSTPAATTKAPAAATTTPAPVADEYATPAATKKKCNRRFRSRA
ncbi:Chitin-binding protein [Globisporangium polare]